MGLPIEHGVPIPPKRNNRGITPTINRLKINDSVFFDATFNSKTIYSTVSRIGRDEKMKFTARQEADGVRVWRIE